MILSTSQRRDRFGRAREDKDGQNNRDVVEDSLTDGWREDSREAVRTTGRITAEVDHEQSE